MQKMLSIFITILFLITCLNSQIAEFPNRIMVIHSASDGTPTMVIDDELNQYDYGINGFSTGRALPLEDLQLHHTHFQNTILLGENKIGVISGQQWKDYTSLITPIVKLEDIKHLLIQNQDNWYILCNSFLLHFNNGLLQKIKFPPKVKSFIGLGLTKEQYLFTYTAHDRFELRQKKWQKTFVSKEEIQSIHSVGNGYFVHTKEKLFVINKEQKKILIHDEVKEGYSLYDSLYVVSFDDTIRIYENAVKLEDIPFENDVDFITNGQYDNLLVGSDEVLTEIKSKSVYPVFENWITSKLNIAEQKGDFNTYRKLLNVAMRFFSKNTKNGQRVLSQTAEDLYWNHKFSHSLELLSQLTNLNEHNIDLKIRNYEQLDMNDSLVTYLLLKNSRSHGESEMVKAFYTGIQLKNIELRETIHNRLLKSGKRSLQQLGEAYDLIFQKKLNQTVSDSMLLKLRPDFIKNGLFVLYYRALVGHWLDTRFNKYRINIANFPDDYNFIDAQKEKLLFIDKSNILEYPDSSIIPLDMQSGESLHLVLRDEDGQIWRHIEDNKYHLIQYYAKGKWHLSKKGRFYKKDLHLLNSENSFYFFYEKILYLFRHGKRQQLFKIPTKLTGNDFIPTSIKENGNMLFISDGKDVFRYNLKNKVWIEEENELLGNLSTVSIQDDILKSGGEAYLMVVNPDNTLSLNPVSSCTDFCLVDGNLVVLDGSSIIFNPGSSREVAIDLGFWIKDEYWSKIIPIAPFSFLILGEKKIASFSFDADLLSLTKLKKLYGDNNESDISLVDLAKSNNLVEILPEDLILLDNSFQSTQNRTYQQAAETLTALKISALDDRWIDLTFYFNVLDGLLDERKYIETISWLSRLWQWFPEQKDFTVFESVWQDIMLYGKKKERLMLVDFIHRQKSVYPQFAQAFSDILRKISHISFTQGNSSEIQSLLNKDLDNRADNLFLKKSSHRPSL